MNDKKNWLILVMLLGMLAGCGGTSAADRAAEEEETEDNNVGEGSLEDTASEVVTTLADVNGFKVTTTTLNPRGYDINGTEVEITAYVKDHSNNPVADGTVVTFESDDNGLIEPQCVTTGGTCTVTWLSARDRNQPVDPDAGGDSGYTGDYLITIMARTIGEDSFIDKNANSKFDVGETFFTQSEAFLDANDNGVYDADSGFDEYSDFNKNGQFDNASSSFFRGESCSDGARAQAHCASRLEVWDTVRMINSSGGQVSMLLTDCSGTTINTVNVSAAPQTVCLEVTDPNGNVPPIGTGISVTTDNGEIDFAPEEVINAYGEPGTPYVGKIRLSSDGTSSTGTMTIETESVNGQNLQDYFSIID